MCVSDINVWKLMEFFPFPVIRALVIVGVRFLVIMQVSMCTYVRACMCQQGSSQVAPVFGLGAQRLFPREECADFGVGLWGGWLAVTGSVLPRCLI